MKIDSVANVQPSVAAQKYSNINANKKSTMDQITQTVENKQKAELEKAKKEATSPEAIKKKAGLDKTEEKIANTANKLAKGNENQNLNIRRQQEAINTMRTGKVESR